MRRYVQIEWLKGWDPDIDDRFYAMAPEQLVIIIRQKEQCNISFITGK